MDFQDIKLEEEQRELLIMVAEAARNVVREDRQKFLVRRTYGGDFLIHPGLGGEPKIYFGDVEALACEGILRVSSEPGGILQFVVTPQGFRYYEYLRHQKGESVERVEAEIRDYLDASAFKKKYNRAYAKWREAEDMLWSSETEGELTKIGHICREAMQEFVDPLVDEHSPPDVDDDKSHTINRLKAVLDQRRDRLGKTEKRFLDALCEYWRVVSDLVQRQEHGAQREGEPLIWEDGRRAAFQTALVMFEVVRALSRIE